MKSNQKMRQLATWVDNDVFQRFQKRVERLKTTRYLRLQYLVRVDVGDIKAHVIRTSIIYVFTLYSLVVSAWLLVFP